MTGKIAFVVRFYETQTGHEYPTGYLTVFREFNSVVCCEPNIEFATWYETREAAQAAGEKYGKGKPFHVAGRTLHYS